jgi:adenylate cyclase
MAGMRTRLLHSLAVGGAAAIIAIALWLAGALDRLEYSAWAWRVAAFAPWRTPAADVKVILLDQASLDWGASEMHWSWPWPREVYGALIDFLHRGGARVVAFDVLYTEPSVYGVADDQALAAAIGRGGPFVAAAFYGRDRTAEPIPEVAGTATRLGNVSDEPDPDGIIRRATLMRSVEGRLVPSLGLAAWQSGLPAAGGAGDWRLEPGWLRLGAYSIPVDPRQRLILNFAGARGTHTTVSAAAVIQSELKLQAGEAAGLNPEAFREAYVFVGFSAPGLMDLHPTPLSRIYPGVEVHATALDNLLAGDMLRDAPPTWVAWVVVLMAWAAAWLALGARNARGSVLAFAVALPVPAGLGFLAYALGLWWPMVVGLLAVALALVGAVVLNYAREGRQKAFIKNAFRHYLGAEVIEELLADPSRLRLGGEKREITVFFSDIEGFSSFSERLDPAVLTALLNDYLSDMGAIIKDEGGYLDKYIGDAIVAFWNAPVAQPDHAARACRAALRCQRRLAERQVDFERQAGSVLRTRIGIHTGEAVVGNMGSHERFNYTILGDAANLASRLEGANKTFGTYLMVSETTWRSSGGDWIGRELACLRVVGRQTPVTVYELAGLPGQQRPEVWVEFDKARQLYVEGRLTEALALFERWPADPASCAYAAQCRRAQSQRQATWTGVWELTEK